MHTGSDILDVGVFERAANLLFDVAAQFSDLKYIDFGSGFKVKYKSEVETDMEDFGEMISRRSSNFWSYGKQLTLIFEPGSFGVSQGIF